MGQALYRKYRSKNLAEIVGQEHITRALSRALEQDKLSHAYLFTGPRGVGKTSIARILAFEVNGLPYDETATHLDIIEIDAASNRRIDEIRDLRDKVHVAPTSAKYKVYIIDEVHMLTREAFNALLKTLEEPPAHVIFVLATTEMHKLPETIVSRTQHYAFKPIEQIKVVEHLRTIAKQEKITVDDDALALIAQHGDGSFRDSISLLDQVRNYAESITVNDVRALLGVAPDTAIAELLEFVSAGDAGKLVLLLEQLREQGIEATMLAKQLMQTLRGQLLAGTLQLAPESALQLMQNLIATAAAPDPYAHLEVCLLEQVFAQQTSVQTAQSAAKPAETPAPKPATPVKSKPANTEAKKAAPAAVAPTPQADAPTGELSDATWPEVLARIKQQYNTMYGVLRMAEVDLVGNTLTLTFAFPFHQKRANDPKNKQIIIDTVRAVSGTVVELVCVVDAKAVPAPVRPEPKTPAPQPVDAAALGTISNIFGGGELLES